MLTPPNTDEQPSLLDVADVADMVGQLQAHRGEFLAFLRHRLRSGADAEDVLQQGLLVATGKLAQLHDPDSLVPWFYRVLRRLLADYHAQWVSREGKLHLLEVEAADDKEVAVCGCALGRLGQLNIVVNLGIVGAAGGVARVDTVWPDVLVGVAIALLGLTSSLSILREARQALHELATPPPTPAPSPQPRPAAAQGLVTLSCQPLTKVPSV